MTYAETLAYLYAQLPMYHRIGPAAYKADLSNTWALMDALGHPERDLRCVHVAGTNGKGSTCHLIASALQEAGYRVGLHTSPHLKDFRERFRINGMVIGEELVTQFVEIHREQFEGIGPSFFEWGVGLALWWFKQQQVDIAVIETGLGGRLDSTNVIFPEVSVITNIGWDHMDLLGHSLEAIAREKAGIIKPGVPVIVGRAEGAVAEVFTAAASTAQAPITFVDHQAPPNFPSALAGAHQEENARTAHAAFEAMRARGWSLPDAAIAHGFERVVANTGLRGRWEVLHRQPLTIADVAHNIDGMRTVLDLLKTTPHDHLHVILGMAADKDIDRVLAILPKHATYYFCKADIPRGLEATKLRDLALVHGLLGEAFGSVGAAFSAARNAAQPVDLVLVTGSVFVVAEVL